MTAGLLAVLSEPGAVPIEDFHEWYDGEHVPARLALPGITSAQRLVATDGESPSWLAIYDVELGTLETPEYRRLREHRSPHEQQIVDNLAALQRRTYELLTDDGTPGSRPTTTVILTSFTMADGHEQELADWYAEEHGPMLLAIPGWERIRRYRLSDGEAPTLLALHELTDPTAPDTDAWRAATSTPWRDEVMAHVTARERRVFQTYRTF